MSRILPRGPSSSNHLIAMTVPHNAELSRKIPHQKYSIDMADPAVKNVQAVLIVHPVLTEDPKLRNRSHLWY